MPEETKTKAVSDCRKRYGDIWQGVLACELKKARIMPTTVKNMPPSIEQCLKNKVKNVLNYDTEYVTTSELRPDGKRIVTKIRLGKIIGEYCDEDAKINYVEWKRREGYYYNTFKVLEDAYSSSNLFSDRFEHNKHLKGMVGRYETPDPRYDIVITQDPLDITLKSTTRFWEGLNCERIGGEYGNPTEWLKTQRSCGFCSDIEYGNPILYVINNQNGEWLGKQEIKWCKQEHSGKIGIGIEQWYGDELNIELQNFKNDLIKRLAESNNIQFEHSNDICRTLYKYSGYSDTISDGNIQIDYIKDFVPREETIKSLIPQWMGEIFDFKGGKMWSYNEDEENRIILMEEFQIPERFIDESEVVGLFNAMHFYHHTTYDTFNLFNHLKKDLVEKKIDAYFIPNMTDLIRYINEVTKGFISISNEPYKSMRDLLFKGFPIIVDKIPSSESLKIENVHKALGDKRFMEALQEFYSQSRKIRKEHQEKKGDYPLFIELIHDVFKK